MANQVETFHYCKIRLPTQLSPKKAIRGRCSQYLLCLRMTRTKPDIEHRVITCWRNHNKRAELKCKGWIICAKSPRHRDCGADVSVSCRVKSSPARSWTCCGDTRWEGFWGASQCQEVAWGWTPWVWWHPVKQPWFCWSLLPPIAGTLIVPSWLRAAPAWLQEGITQGTLAWDSTMELVPKKRERGFSPSWLPAWWNAAVTDPCRS